MSFALFSLLGIVVGASLQYFFARFLEHRKHYQLLQTQAYVDYLRGVAEAAHLNLSTNEPDIFARVADAKTPQKYYVQGYEIALGYTMTCTSITVGGH